MIEYISTKLTQVQSKLSTLADIDMPEENRISQKVNLNDKLDVELNRMKVRYFINGTKVFKELKEEYEVFVSYISFDETMDDIKSLVDKLVEPFLNTGAYASGKTPLSFKEKLMPIQIFRVKNKITPEVFIVRTGYDMITNWFSDFDVFNTTVFMKMTLFDIINLVLSIINFGLGLTSLIYLLTRKKLKREVKIYQTREEMCEKCEKRARIQETQSPIHRTCSVHAVSRNLPTLKNSTRYGRGVSDIPLNELYRSTSAINLPRVHFA